MLTSAAHLLSYVIADFVGVIVVFVFDDVSGLHTSLWSQIAKQRTESQLTSPASKPCVTSFAVSRHLVRRRRRRRHGCLCKFKFQVQALLFSNTIHEINIQYNEYLKVLKTVKNNKNG